MKKALTLILALCLILSLFGGIGGTAFADAKKTMVIGDTTFNAENWEETVDPHRTYNGWPCIRYGIGETLVHYTDTMELEPWLATAWENDGALNWTITLRDDVSFSSGRKMDAEAVKASLTWITALVPSDPSRKRLFAVPPLSIPPVTVPPVTFAVIFGVPPMSMAPSDERYTPPPEPVPAVVFSVTVPPYMVKVPCLLPTLLPLMKIPPP